MIKTKRGRIAGNTLATLALIVVGVLGGIQIASACHEGIQPIIPECCDPCTTKTTYAACDNCSTAECGGCLDEMYACDRWCKWCFHIT